MISREDAHSIVDITINRQEGRRGLHRVIDEIYDSVGMCSECKHHVIDNGEICCGIGCFDPVEEDFFCADFEMKEVDFYLGKVGND
jgi:hypothetical protein